jgi:mannose-6-phosphate isomerase-like protein (cupin superfamily)
MKAGKIWGTTELVEANGALEFHRIEMVKGGVCSKHMHELKWNGFFVESGKLIVRVWQKDYDLVDETIIGPGQYTKVKPGLYHQFECLEDGVAFELYWAEFNHNDIKRETVGYSGNTVVPKQENLTLTFPDDNMSTVTLTGVSDDTFVVTTADDD